MQQVIFPQVDEGDCPNCGCPMDDTAMKCPHCGAEFCGNCFVVADSAEGNLAGCPKCKQILELPLPA